MTRQVLGVAVYRFRRTFSRRRGGYLALVALIGLLGGVAMGAVAGARRTQAAYPIYLASTNPSDIQLFSGFQPLVGFGYSPALNEAISKVRYVKHSVNVIGFDGTLQVLGPAFGNLPPGEAPPALEGSTNGGYSTQDRLTLVKGRMANPRRLDEFVMSARGAADGGLHIGSTVPLAFFTNAQVASPTYAGYPTDTPNLLIKLKLVGIVKASYQVVEDDDTALQDQLGVVTPALTRRLANCCAYYSNVGLQIEGGARHQAAVIKKVRAMLPGLGRLTGVDTSAPFVAKAERAIRPESIAFGVFGLRALLAALLIGGQVVSRLIRRNAEDGPVLRALGAGPAMTTGDGLVGVFSAVVLGSALAVAVAVALSPLAPFGAVRSVYPGLGIALDWTVLGLGMSVFVVVLCASAVVIAYRASPHRVRLAQGKMGGGAEAARRAGALGLPPAAVTGIRAGFGGGSRRDAAPVRSALLGAVLAVVVVVTAITFGASLNSLVSRPALYGWNWDYALLSGFSGQEDLPAAETASLLRHDVAVARSAGAYLVTIRLDGKGVPTLAMHPRAPVGPPLLSGHGLESEGQVVLGPVTLASLHKHVGDTVMAQAPGSSAVRLRIVGTATLPTIKGSSGYLQMGSGAVVSSSLYPESDLNLQGSPIPGPNLYLITMRPGTSRSMALHSLDRITQVLNQPSDADGPIGGAVSALRPAEIANYRAVGSIPTVLAGALAAGALGALGLALVASVRRRRREFALLKALGFSQRQLAASVAWQASVSAAVGVVVGMPLGIVLGRWLWTLFARAISAVPYPTVSWVWMVLIALGALVFANAVATIPGRLAAGTPTALLLQAE